MVRMASIIATLVLSFLACFGAMAQNNGPLKTPQASQQSVQAPAPLIATPRQDRHDGLSISVDPYSEPARAKEKFGRPIPCRLESCRSKFPCTTTPIARFMWT